MTYVLADRMNLLGPRMQGLNSVEVTIAFDGESVTLQATPMQAEDAEEMSGAGFRARADRLDWIIDTAELNEVETLPVPGMTITWGDRTFNVVSSGDDPLVMFNYTTSSRERMRIHTVEH